MIFVTNILRKNAKVIYIYNMYRERSKILFCNQCSFIRVPTSIEYRVKVPGSLSVTEVSDTYYILNPHITRQYSM